MLPMQEAWVRSLLREVRSHIFHMPMMMQIRCTPCKVVRSRRRITGNQVLELAVEDVGRCGSLEGFPVEVMSCLRSERDAVNIVAEGTNT